ncbi:2-oxoglutarate dehydrogenase E1 component [Ignatzschineria indica]|uniref:2-oxoglutarate dehydrogenase E1 component n=1 Tax=Ignatzschineria indica TaxID=472583 RepID=UPI00257859E8|nr:2-oxoglutarate dehydrogenase E1 component [Ignatzschineria indica]MDM1546144.1 2-oxoglutarate dehydrogenase E1 component [Ignatzschineria indica]
MKLIDKFRETSALYGANQTYVEEMFESYLEDPSSVSAQWQAYFADFKNSQGEDVAQGPVKRAFEQMRHQGVRVQSAGVDEAHLEKQVAVLNLIGEYRRRGHQVADLCPLNLRDIPNVPELNPGHYGLTEMDMGTTFKTGGLAGKSEMTLRDILDVLKKTYTGHIGAEFEHITKDAERDWIRTRLEEVQDHYRLSDEERIETLKELISADGLERYLHTRYVGQKRFSLEGGDALIPMLHEMVVGASNFGAEEIVIGMAHRGRLNTLVNILGKAPKQLFAEFEGVPTFSKGSGDVKYHMGYSSSVIASPDNPPVHLALAFNPSHLEIVNPVVEGSVRARLERRIEPGTPTGHLPFNTVLPVLIHGDAAFAGQGIVLETLQMSQARGYTTGGTVHIVVNNRVGFTTSNPLDARSSEYCTDAAKIVQAPVLHVNGDDPEAVKHVMQLALGYRNTFHKDVVIDLVCYRKLGHNEADEPSATQPMMYKKVRSHKTPARIYADRLIAQGLITEEDFKNFTQEYRDKLEEGTPVGFPTVESINSSYMQKWEKISKMHDRFDEEGPVVPETGVVSTRITELARIMNQLPESLKLHNRVQRIHDNRLKMGEGELEIDWGFAEVMAYATLLEEGYPIRITGQDSGRGTFFHRHAVYHNQEDGSSYIPLQHLTKDQANFTVIDSILSEAGVLGFEYGYASTEPNTLVIWEAQFGDFVNGAQVVIDQFIASGETKWRRYNGLVMLLPHGYEGQGPEHSSARPERFLELCAENNISFVVPTTPAQAFHMFRRQMHQDYRKPLIVMSPKSLLRHRQAVSTLEELATGTFRSVLSEIDAIDAAKVERVVISVGKIYYDARDRRAAVNDEKTAIIRLEEIYPFPAAALATELAKYPNAKEVIFLQDEPRNQGYATFVYPYLTEMLGDKHALRFVTRPAAAAPAVGYSHVHAAQEKALLDAIFPLAE